MLVRVLGKDESEHNPIPWSGGSMRRTNREKKRTRWSWEVKAVAFTSAGVRTKGTSAAGRLGTLLQRFRSLHLGLLLRLLLLLKEHLEELDDDGGVVLGGSRGTWTWSQSSPDWVKEVSRPQGLARQVQYVKMV